MSAARHAILYCAVLGGLAVAMGAFGAHLLTPWLETLEPAVREQRLATYRTAAHYHLVHALAIGLVGVWISVVGDSRRRPHRAGMWSGRCFLVGILLFSGPLYLLGVFGAPGWLGMVAPLGGTALLAGWTFLFLAGWCWQEL